MVPLLPLTSGRHVLPPPSSLLPPLPRVADKRDTGFPLISSASLPFQPVSPSLLMPYSYGNRQQLQQDGTLGDSASSLGPWHQAATLVLGETAMATSPTSPRPLTLADANKSHSLHAKQSFIEDLDGRLHLNEWYAACNLPAAVLVAIDKKNKLCQGGGSISAAKDGRRP